MDTIKYRIRKRVSGEEIQYYVDYKRIDDSNKETTLEDIPWMGGFYAKSEDEAKDIVKRHREYEELRKRLQMNEEVIYDETEEEK